MERLFALFITAVLLFAQPATGRANADSIGILTLDDQSFILYQVAAGETLYGISKKYNMKVEELLAVNPYVSDNKINQGQILKIPVKLVIPDTKTMESNAKQEDSGKQLDSKPEKNQTVQEDSKQQITADPTNTEPKSGTDLTILKLKHTVQPGETLFSLSRKYEVQVNDIMEWNNLGSYAIRVGQELIVGTGQVMSENISQNNDHQTRPSNPATSFANSKDYLKQENLLSLKYKEDLSSAHYTEVKKTGVAAWITSSSSYPTKNGYYALHKELPVGSVIKVKNLMNSKVVYAKVIGKLPESQDNNKILLKLPESAAKEMNVLDETLIMEVTYLERR